MSPPGRPPRESLLPSTNSKLLVLVTLSLAVALAVRLAIHPELLAITTMRPSSAPVVAALAGVAVGEVDLKWHAPNKTALNGDIADVLKGEGVYGFIYNSSTTPDAKYGTYNWCNMPHVRKDIYVKPSDDYELQYVELIHRHHKRTVYASNAFPVESYPWDCTNQGLYYYGQRIPPGSGPLAATSAQSYWAVQGSSPANPFLATLSGFHGSCQFPQITAEGLDDSFVHGADLYAVYHDLLNFLPSKDSDKPYLNGKVEYRVTNNVITSQVAGMLIAGTWGPTTGGAMPLTIQPSGVDSLEPQYSCSAGSNLFNSGPRGSAEWNNHLSAAAPLFAELDAISGVPSSDSGWHASFDHYYDNLSARLCHALPLPCAVVDGKNDTSRCISQAQADAVFRLGHWEYSRMYRDDSSSLAAATGQFGVWVAELAAHLRDVVSKEGTRGRGKKGQMYVHNVAHDGSVSKVLALLQVDGMVWPGMGAEVVFEVWRKKAGNGKKRQDGSACKGRNVVRVLFGGRVLRSSNPSLGVMDMIPVETLLEYFDGLVGKDASLMKGKCSGSIPL